MSPTTTLDVLAVCSGAGGDGCGCRFSREELREEGVSLAGNCPACAHPRAAHAGSAPKAKPMYVFISIHIHAHNIYSYILIYPSISIHHYTIYIAQYLTHTHTSSSHLPSLPCLPGPLPDLSGAGLQTTPSSSGGRRWATGSASPEKCACPRPALGSPSCRPPTADTTASPRSASCPYSRTCRMGTTCTAGPGGGAKCVGRHAPSTVSSARTYPRTPPCLTSCTRYAT
jgi:hypothetical protein